MSRRELRDGRRRELLARALAVRSRLVADGWPVGYVSVELGRGMSRKAGLYTEYGDGTGKITLSWCLFKDGNDAQFIDTVLHEFAHAIVGCEHGHDSVWKQACEDIGCSGLQYHEMAWKPRNGYKKYIGKCAACGASGPISTVRANKILRGKCAYVHNCGGRLVVERVADRRGRLLAKRADLLRRLDELGDKGE